MNFLIFDITFLPTISRWARSSPIRRLVRLPLPKEVIDGGPTLPEVILRVHTRLPTQIL